jgi:hypothetical protein
MAIPLGLTSGHAGRGRLPSRGGRTAEEHWWFRCPARAVCRDLDRADSRVAHRVEEIAIEAFQSISVALQRPAMKTNAV